MVNPDSSQKDYDGIGIGMVKRPPYCDRTTRKGDKLRVHFNGTLPDGSVFESRYSTSTFYSVIPLPDETRYRRTAF